MFPDWCYRMLNKHEGNYTGMHLLCCILGDPRSKPAAIQTGRLANPSGFGNLAVCPACKVIGFWTMTRLWNVVGSLSLIWRVSVCVDPWEGFTESVGGVDLSPPLPSWKPALCLASKMAPQNEGGGAGWSAKGKLTKIVCLSCWCKLCAFLSFFYRTAHCWEVDVNSLPPGTLRTFFSPVNVTGG